MSGHKNIPLEERRRLREKMYKKHNLANILTHWFNVAMWLMLLPTGIAIISSPRAGSQPRLDAGALPQPVRQHRQPDPLSLYRGLVVDFRA